MWKWNISLCSCGPWNEDMVWNSSLVFSLETWYATKIIQLGPCNDCLACAQWQPGPGCARPSLKAYPGHSGFRGLELCNSTGSPTHRGSSPVSDFLIHSPIWCFTSELATEISYPGREEPVGNMYSGTLFPLYFIRVWFLMLGGDRLAQGSLCNWVPVISLVSRTPSWCPSWV